MNANDSGQEAHHGSVLHPPTGGHDFADASNYPIILVPAIVPPAMIVSSMAVVRKQRLRLLLCLFLIEPLAMNQRSIRRVILKHMNRSGHIRVNQANYFVVASLWEGYGKGCAAIQTSGGGHTCAAIIRSRGPAGYALDRKRRTCRGRR